MQTTVEARILQTFYKGLAIAGNMLTFMAIAGGISMVVKAINDHIHAGERAIETAKEASSRIQSLNETYASHKKTVDDCASSYDKLSKGVARDTNQNISLNDEDYQKFLDINRQLAETFPELITAMDENGNAVLNLGASGRSTAKDLQELLKAEEELNNYKISKDLDDVFGGVKVQVDQALEDQKAYEDELAKKEGVLNKLNEYSMGKIQIGESIQFSVDYANEGDLAYFSVIKSSLEAFSDQIDGERQTKLMDDLNTAQMMRQNMDDNTADFYFNAANLTSEEKHLLKQIIQEQSKEVAIQMSDSMGSAMMKQKESTKAAEMAWKDFIPNLTAAMKSKPSFQELDETTQALAVRLVKGLQMNVTGQIDKEGAYNYIRNSILLPITNLPEEDLRKLSMAYEKLFSPDMDSLPVEEAKKQIDSYIQILADIMNADPVELKLRLGFSNIDGFVSNYNTTIRKAAEKFSGQSSLSMIKGGGGDFEKEYKELERFARQNSIKTQDELAFWSQCIEESDTREDAMRMYLDGRESSGRSLLSYSGTFAELEKMDGALNAIYTVYKHLSDMDSELTFDDLISINEHFKDVSGVEDYIRAIHEAKGDTEAARSAVEDLLNAYLEQSHILDQVNQDNAGLIQSYLEEKGVANANLLVQNALAKSKAETAWATRDLSNASEETILSLINETGATEEAKNAFAAYIVQKMLAESALSVDADISALIAVVESLGIATTAWQRYFAVKERIQQIDADPNYVSYDEDGSRVSKETVIDQYRDLEAIYMKEAEADLKTLYGKAQIKPSGGQGPSGGAQGSGSKAPFSEELNGLDRRLDLSERRLEDYKHELEDALTVEDKNNAIDHIIKENEYQTAKQAELFTLYSRQVEEILSQIPETMREHVKEGMDGIENLNDETLSELIKEYYKLDQAAYDADCRMRELKNTIDDMKKQRIQIQIDELERSNAKLERIKSQYESAISAVTSSIQSEIDDVNQYYDSQTKRIQDQIDALDEQNDKLEMQRRLEQALYDLRRAENQRSSRIYREGKGFVYEADQDAVRDARQDYDEAVFEKTKYDLQEILDGLKKERDEEIQYLTDILDAWNDIADSFERMADIEIADELFSGGWLEEILSGDTDLFDEMKSNFGDVFERITESEQALEYLNDLMALIESGELSEDTAIAVMDRQITQLGENTAIQAGTIGDGYASIYHSAENAKNLSSETYAAWTEHLTLFQEQSLAVCNSLVSQFNSMADAIVEAVRRAKEAEKELDDSGGDSGDGDGYTSSKDPIHSGSSGGINASIHHKGILNGTFEASAGQDSRVEALKRLSTEKLKPGEVPIIGLKDEIAFTKEQQDTLLENIGNNTRPIYAIPSSGLTQLQPSKPDMQNIEYIFNGGIHISEAQNVTDIAKGITDGMLRQALNQEIYRR